MPISRRQLLATVTGATTACILKRTASGGAPEVPIPLGHDHFAVRAMGWNSIELIQYAEKLQLDTLFLSDLDCLPSLDSSQLVEIKSHADASGLKLYVGSWSICPTSVRFKPKWGTAEEHLKTGIRVAKTLGSPVFRVILGASDDRKTPGGIEARIEDCIRVLRTCRSFALEHGVKIAVENHAGDMHSWELVKLVERAGPEFVGVNVDSGNAAWTLEDPLDSLERLGPFTVCSSLRDDMIWETPDGAAVQWTAIGEGLVDWRRYLERWRVLCPKVPFHIETISGFSRAFHYKAADFWTVYDRRPEALSKFEALAKKGRPLSPFQPAPGVDKKSSEQEFQKAELERSVKYCREELGLGLRGRPQKA